MTSSQRIGRGRDYHQQPELQPESPATLRVSQTSSELAFTWPNAVIQRQPPSSSSTDSGHRRQVLSYEDIDTPCTQRRRAGSANSDHRRLPSEADIDFLLGSERETPTPSYDDSSHQGGGQLGGTPAITTSEKRRRHREAVRDGAKMPRLKRKRAVNVDAELSSDDFTRAVNKLERAMRYHVFLFHTNNDVENVIDDVTGGLLDHDTNSFTRLRTKALDNIRNWKHDVTKSCLVYQFHLSTL